MLFEETEARAISAEANVRGSIARIQHLQENLTQRGEKLDTTLALPAKWPDLADWCGENLIGRLVLAPAARRSVKKPAFEDVSLTARCLIWLANECRNRRIKGGGSLSELVIEDGVRNSACGAYTYKFEFQGQRLDADWHIKNGGNTRDPSRCLRIYYGWHQQSQQIVVADMPAHRRTDAT